MPATPEPMIRKSNLRIMMVFVLFLFFFLGIATCHEVVARLVGRKYKLHLDATLVAGKKSKISAFVVHLS